LEVNLELQQLDNALIRVAGEILRHLNNAECGLSTDGFDWGRHDLLVIKLKELIEVRNMLKSE
jgi:hypothetical protein